MPLQERPGQRLGRRGVIGVIGEGGGKAGVFVDGKVISTPN
jgi:hypothetical protein